MSHNDFSMTLGQKQRLFTRLMAEWTIWVYQQGYELSDGDAYRDKRVHGDIGERVGYGRANSNHKQRLARDYNLFIDGVYQTSTEAHKPLGDKWESMHHLCAWGGRNNNSDGNHYCFTHNGRW